MMPTQTIYPCDFDWEPSPPGETIQELLEYYDMSQKELAKRTGYSVKQINQVILGNVALTSELAVLLERVLGTSAQTWKNLESHYQIRKTKWAEKERLVKEKSILKEPAIIELKKRRIIPSGDIASEVDSVLKFFGVGTVEALYYTCKAPLQAALRHSPAFGSDALPLTAWLRLAEREAIKMPCEAFNRERFLEVLKKIRLLTLKTPNEFVPEMIRLCASAGVALVFIREFNGAKANGATKWLTPNKKAMIALNLRGKKNDIFWFTFFHEAGHILCDKNLMIETDDKKSIKSKSEKDADEFAASFLIPKADAKRLATLKTAKDIISFADRIGVAPGIVVGRMQYEKLIEFNQFTNLRVPFKWKQ